MNDHEDILDKFKAGLNRGLRIVNVRSKEAYDVLKTKNSIQGKNRHKRKLVEELGNAVFRTYKHKGNISEDSIKNKCEDILNLESQIDDLEVEIQNIHENALKELGKLKAITKPANSAKCECGAEVSEDTDKCPECGKELNKS
ncbi:MAG: hypothetical protein GWO07_06595 [Candidatus Dadabacteria bacterium]|nr:hypothetical protein [Candidatus Dadabacteria bacterium]NIS08420.1 hypothetical protein [Candidatus Dadabacteria bacterium]NIV41985.1 hypothetical protein [Candidatus Dadabacteria bacterium]NIX15291.1 hypothetical protein [Candidatus Dadabacteria bacterium]NIY21908.1 hypothetical protein [Candidatus Dadabacteria bacterium]